MYILKNIWRSILNEVKENWHWYGVLLIGYIFVNSFLFN